MDQRRYTPGLDYVHSVIKWCRQEDLPLRAIVLCTHRWSLLYKDCVKNTGKLSFMVEDPRILCPDGVHADVQGVFRQAHSGGYMPLAFTIDGVDVFLNHHHLRFNMDNEGPRSVEAINPGDVIELRVQLTSDITAAERVLACVRGGTVVNMIDLNPEAQKHLTQLANARWPGVDEGWKLEAGVLPPGEAVLDYVNRMRHRLGLAPLEGLSDKEHAVFTHSLQRDPRVREIVERQESVSEATYPTPPAVMNGNQAWEWLRQHPDNKARMQTWPEDRLQERLWVRWDFTEWQFRDNTGTLLGPEMNERWHTATNWEPVYLDSAHTERFNGFQAQELLKKNPMKMAVRRDAWRQLEGEPQWLAWNGTLLLGSNGRTYGAEMHDGWLAGEDWYVCVVGPVPSAPDTDSGESIAGEVRQPPSFQTELERLINRHSMENGSDTPDYVLAEYLCNALAHFDLATRSRDRHKGYDRRRSGGDGPVPEDPPSLCNFGLDYVGHARDIKPFDGNAQYTPPTPIQYEVHLNITTPPGADPNDVAERVADSMRSQFDALQSRYRPGADPYFTTPEPEPYKRLINPLDADVIAAKLKEMGVPDLTHVTIVQLQEALLALGFNGKVHAGSRDANYNFQHFLEPRPEPTSRAPRTTGGQPPDPQSQS